MAGDASEMRGIPWGISCEGLAWCLPGSKGAEQTVRAQVLDFFLDAFQVHKGLRPFAGIPQQGRGVVKGGRKIKWNKDIT